MNRDYGKIKPPNIVLKKCEHTWGDPELTKEGNFWSFCLHACGSIRWNDTIVAPLRKKLEEVE